MVEEREQIAERIRSARKRLGLTQMDVARRAGIAAHQTISQIETGRRDVKAWELAKLARALETSLADLLGSVERRAPATIRWREPPGNRREEVEARFLRRCEEYATVEALSGVEPSTDLPRYEPDRSSVSYADVSDLAAEVAKWLDLGSKPATSLTKALEEEHGVKIWYEDLRDGGSAASALDGFGAAMLINRNEAPWRRNFDCAHELFHLVTWRSLPYRASSKGRRDADQLENWANAFASALLLPADELLPILDRRADGRGIAYGSLIEVARRFDVSSAALVWRLVNLGRVKRSEAKRVLADPKFGRLDRASMVGKWWEPPPLPQRFVRLAFLAFERGRLSRARLAELLETSLLDLPSTLRDYGFDELEDYEAELALA